MKKENNGDRYIWTDQTKHRKAGIAIELQQQLWQYHTQTVTGLSTTSPGNKDRSCSFINLHLLCKKYGETWSAPANNPSLFEEYQKSYCSLFSHHQHVLVSEILIVSLFSHHQHEGHGPKAGAFLSFGCYW